MADLTQLELQKWVETTIYDWEKQNPAFHLADRLAPRVSVPNRTGVWVEALTGENTLWNLSRAPGSKPTKLEHGYKKGNTYECIQLGGAEQVTREHRQTAASEFGLDVFADKATKLMAALKNWREALVCSRFISVDPNTYDYSNGLGLYDNYTNQVVTLTEGEHWNQSTSSPFDDIRYARNWFEKNSYVVPDTIVIPSNVALWLREHADYKAEFGNNQDLFAIGAINPVLRDLNVIVARQKAVINGSTQNFFGNNVWIGKLGRDGGHAIQLEYAAGESGTVVREDQESRTFTVEIMDGEVDVVVPKLGGSVSGFLFRDVIKAGF